MTKLLQDLPAARKASTEAQAKVKAENARHTPGPWEAKPTGPWDGWDGWSVEDASGSVACDAHGSQRDGQREANARLIAAAPDLLEALLAMEREKSDYMRLNHLGDPSNETTNKMARAAIAKAQGSQQ